MATVAGTWSTEQAAVLEPDGGWLRAPEDSSLDVQVPIAALKDESYGLPVGVFRPLGAEHAVVVSDVMQSPSFTVRFACYGPAERAAVLAAVASGRTLLVQGKADVGGGGDYAYFRPAGPVTQERAADGRAWRYVQVPAVTVARP